MSDFNSRFDKVMNHLKLSNYRIALDLDMSKSTIGNYRNQKSSPNGTIINDLANYLHQRGVSKSWLLSGEGEMMEGNNKNVIKMRSSEYDKKEKPSQDNARVEDIIAQKVIAELKPYIGKLTEEIVNNIGGMDIELSRIKEYLEEIHKQQEKTQELIEKKQ